MLKTSRQCYVNRSMGWIVVAVFIALNWSSCAKVIEVVSDADTGDADGGSYAGTDSAVERLRFPSGAIATYGWPNETRIGGSQLLVYPADATSTTPPLVAFDPGSYCGSLAFDGQGLLYVAFDPPSPATPHVDVFAPQKDDGVVRIRVVEAARLGSNDHICDIAVDSLGNLYLAICDPYAPVGPTVPSNSQIVVVAPNAKKDAPPARIIGGEHTSISQAHDITVDGGGRLVVVNQGGKTVMFAPDADGDIAPIRGPWDTADGPSAVTVDSSGMIYVSDVATDSIFVYDPGENLNPVRVISGSLTGLDFPRDIATDAARRLHVPSGSPGPMRVFPADANGNVVPSVGVRSAISSVAIAP